jgi:integrase
LKVNKPKRRGPRGGMIPYEKWYVRCAGPRGGEIRIAGYKDKAATEELGRKVERLVELRDSGKELSPDLRRWLERLSPKIRAALCQQGLIDAEQIAANRPLTALIDDFEASLTSRDRTAKHVRQSTRRVRDAFKACGFTFWTDIDALILERHLRQRREGGLASKTSNDILAACKQFARWARDHDMASRDPLGTLKPVRVVRTEEDRVLTWDDELPRLIKAAASGPDHRGVSGPLRALVYRLAAETGFRVGELCALRVGDCRLDGDRPTLRLPGSSTKNRNEAIQPIRVDTAEELAPHLRDRLPTALALPLPRSFRDKAPRWLNFDLEAAGIPLVDESGCVFHFHSLRKTFLTGVAQTGAHAKVYQGLARHSSPHMTLTHYLKLGRDDERNAIEALPLLPSTQGADSRQRATGTDRVAVCVPVRSGSDESPVDQPGHSIPTEGPRKAVSGVEDGGGGGSRTRVLESPLPGRLRV